MTDVLVGWCSSCGQQWRIEKEEDMVGKPHRDGCAYAIARSRRKADEFVQKHGSPLMTMMKKEQPE